MRIVKLFDLPPIEGMNDDNCGPKVSCSHLVVACQFLRSGSVVKRNCDRALRDGCVLYCSSIDHFQ